MSGSAVFAFDGTN